MSSFYPIRYPSVALRISGRQSCQAGLFLCVLALLLLLSGTAGAMELVGRVGGKCTSIAHQGNHVFVCEGSGLAVFNDSGPGDPVAVARLPFDSLTTCVRLYSCVAYVGTEDGKIRLYDITSPATPALLSTVTGHGALREAVFDGIYAYLATGGGVVILDISNAAAPVELSFTAIAGNITDLALRGATLYVPVGETISIFDVTDRTSPANGGSITLPPYPNAVLSVLFGTALIACEDDHLYVAWNVAFPAFPSLVIARLATYNLAADAAPQLVSVTQGVPPRVAAFVLSGQRVFVSGFIGSRGEVRVFAVGDPTTPTDVGHFDLGDGNQASDLFIDEDLLAISHGSGWTGINVPDTGEIAVDSVYTSTLALASLAVSGGVCAIAQGRGILLTDVRDPHRPEFLANIPCAEDVVDVESDGRYLYSSQRTSGLSISDISNSSMVVSVASFDPLGGSGINDVTYGELSKLGNVVALAYVSGTVGDALVGLVTIDVSNPEEPILLGSASRPRINWVDRPSIAQSGSGVCVSWDRLFFFDVSDPTNPLFMSEFDALPNPGRLLWDGNLVAASGVDGTRLVDVSDLSVPTDAGTRFVSTWHLLVGFENGRLYAGLGDHPRFRIYDAASSQSPAPLDSLSTLGYATNSAISGGHVYALDPVDGLLVVRTNFPDHVAQRHLLGSDTGAADQNSDGVIDAADLVLAMAAARE